MAVLALLFHPVQNLSGLLFCLLIHTCFFYFIFKSADIGNILRMHLIQLVLQKINLFFNG